MKIVRVRHKKLDTLTHLDQLGLLERAYFPGSYVYALVEETAGNVEEEDSEALEEGEGSEEPDENAAGEADEKEGEDAAPLNRAHGVLMYSVHKNSLFIDWIYIEREYRNTGFADELIARAFEHGESIGLRIFAYLPRLYGRNRVCAREADFLSDYFEEERLQSAGEWTSSLRALSRHRCCIAKEAEGEEMKVSAFSELTTDEEWAVLWALSGLEEETLCFDLPKTPFAYEAQLSFIAYEPGKSGHKLVGALLVQNAGGTLYPVLFYYDSVRTRNRLWKRFIEAALKVCPPGKRVTMILRTEKNEDALAASLDDLFQVNRKGYGRHIEAGFVRAREREKDEEKLIPEDEDPD